MTEAKPLTPSRALKIRRIDFSPDEFIAGTMELSDAECGIYWRLCALIYSRGRAVSRNELRAISPSHGNAFNAVLRRLITTGKVVENGADLIVKRCANELEKAEKRIGNLRENGAKGGRPPKQINDIPEPKGLPSRAGNHQLPTTNHQLKKDSVASATGADAPPDDPVKEIFDRGLKILGMAQRALLGKFRKRHGDVVVLEAICACEQEHPSDPIPFFVRCCETHASPQRKSPSTTLYEGAYRAAESWARDNQSAQDRRTGGEPAEPLLDRRRLIAGT